MPSMGSVMEDEGIRTRRLIPKQEYISQVGTPPPMNYAPE